MSSHDVSGVLPSFEQIPLSSCPLQSQISLHSGWCWRLKSGQFYGSTSSVCLLTTHFKWGPSDCLPGWTYRRRGTQYTRSSRASAGPRFPYSLLRKAGIHKGRDDRPRRMRVRTSQGTTSSAESSFPDTLLVASSTIHSQILCRN